MRGRRCRRAGDAAGRVDRGSVTAEFAVALPALVLLLTVALGAVDAVLDKVRCVDAARDAALTSARGGDGVQAARSRAPAGASVRVTIVDGTARAVVTMSIRPLGVRAPAVTVEATAVAATEPGVGR